MARGAVLREDLGLAPFIVRQCVDVRNDRAAKLRRGLYSDLNSDGKRHQCDPRSRPGGRDHDHGHPRNFVAAEPTARTS